MSDVGKRVRWKKSGSKGEGILMAVNCDESNIPHLVQGGKFGWTFTDRHKVITLSLAYKSAHKQGVKVGDENLEWVESYEVIEEEEKHPDIGKRVKIAGGYGKLLVVRDNFEQRYIVQREDGLGGPATESNVKDGVPLGTKNIWYCNSYEVIEETSESISEKGFTTHYTDISLTPKAIKWASEYLMNPMKISFDYGSSLEDWSTIPPSFDKPNKAHRVINNMSKVVTFFKNLKVDANTKLLRKFSLEDDCGNPTDDGIDLSDLISFRANREAIIEHCKGLEKEEKKDKK